jgi:hypothetical protein
MNQSSQGLTRLLSTQLRQYGGDKVYLPYLYSPKVQPLALALTAINHKLNSLIHKPTPIANLQFEWWKQEINKAMNVSYHLPTNLVFDWLLILANDWIRAIECRSRV